MLQKVYEKVHFFQVESPLEHALIAMPRTVTIRDRGNLIQPFQDGAQTLKSHGGIQTQIVCVLLGRTQKKNSQTIINYSIVI